MLYAADVLALVARSTFRPMEESDRWGFAGVESDNALIASNLTYVIILDGNRVCIIAGDGEEQHFVLSENLFA